MGGLLVIGPEGAVVPDVKHKLPGRGVWVTASRNAVAAAAAATAAGAGVEACEQGQEGAAEGVGVFGGVSVLVPVGIGVTAYGAAYTLLHDVAIHRRLPIPMPRRLLEPWRRAHAVHHRFNDAPYGFLAPVVPRRLRNRAETVEPDVVTRPLGERVQSIPR